MKLVVIFALSLAIVTLSPLSAAEKSDPVWFVFLTRGSGPRPQDQNELMKMQEAHIANFKRRFAEGKLLAAGPLDDPSGFLRGIVILQVRDKAEVRRCFDGDPYVENKIMDLDSFHWDADPATINVDSPDPNSIEENRLLLIRQVGPSHLDVAKLAAHRSYAGKSYPSRVQGEEVNGPFRRIILFSGTDETGIRKAMADDPLTGAQGVQFNLLRLWLAKGVLSKAN